MAARRTAAVVAALFLFIGGRSAAAPRASPSVPSAPIRGVVIDPADYLSRVPDAAALARQLVDELVPNGVNVIYLNAYNVEYGAYYRTSYRYNSEGPYGKQDLLGKLIAVAHARGIRVFAAFYDHQHRGAWEANPSWRAQRRDGSDYNPPATDVQFYLSVVQPDAVAWWLGFLNDVLTSYPTLDGVELREPIINWWGTDADWNPSVTAAFEAAYPGAPLGGVQWRSFRAQTLTTFLHREIAAVHAHKMIVHVTTVGSTYQNGRLIPFTELASESGFDVDGLLRGRDRPDAIKVEIIWQQWARLWDFVTFTPEWTATATRLFVSMIGGRVPIIVHLELTQFGRHVLTRSEFAASLAYAQQKGVSGLDLYSAAIADQRDFWPVIRAAYTAIKPVEPARSQGAKALILYDGRSAPGIPAELSRMNAVELANLLGHFTIPWRVQTVESYRSGDMEGYSVVFYIGTVYGNASRAFSSDAAVYGKTLVWIGQNLFQLLSEGRRAPITQPKPSPDASFVRVRYAGQVAGQTGDAIPTLARPGATVVAWLERKDGTRAPYIVRVDKLWYVAGSPFTSIDSRGMNGRYVVFADVLEDIIGQTSPTTASSLVRIDGVTPTTDAQRLDSLRGAMATLAIPYAVAVTPIATDGARTISLSQRPGLTKVLRGMASDGANMILQGSTSSEASPPSTAFEFWDPASADGVPDDGADYVRSRLERAFAEMWKAGLHPMAWRTPGDAATAYDYAEFAGYVTTFVERRTYGSWDDVTYRQPMPYLIDHDVYDARIVPENLGASMTTSQVNEVLSRAAALRMVRGSFAGVGVSVAIDPAALTRLANGLRTQGFTPFALGVLPASVVTTTRVEVAVSGTASLTVPSGATLIESVVRRNGTPESEKSTTYDSYIRVTRPVSLSDGSVFVLALAQPGSHGLFGWSFLDRAGWWLVFVILSSALIGLLALGVFYRTLRARAREVTPG